MLGSSQERSAGKICKLQCEVRMSATKDIKHQFSQVKRKEGETDEQLARRLFYLQAEVYSANAARTLFDEDAFEKLGSEIQNQWLELAKKYK